MKKQGFTLVEILFAVAIIGLLATIGIPSILGAMERASNRLEESNILLIEKAKSMLQLPQIVFSAGRSLTNGTPFDTGAYTESNLMACIKIKTCLADFDFKNARLIPGAIGEKAYYEYVNEAAASRQPER